MLSEYVIWYLFVAGTGAGALAIAVVLDLAQASRHRLGAVPFESKVGLVSAAALLSLSALLLFLDLGNPGAIAFLFANPFRSVLAAGAWLIVLGIAASAALAWMALTRTGTRWLFFVPRGLSSSACIARMVCLRRALRAPQALKRIAST